MHHKQREGLVVLQLDLARQVLHRLHHRGGRIVLQQGIAAQGQLRLSSTGSTSLHTGNTALGCITVQQRRSCQQRTPVQQHPGKLHPSRTCSSSNVSSRK